NKRQSPKRSAEDTKRLYDTFGPNAVGVEEGVLELVFRDLLAGLPVIPQKADKDKVRRLLAVARFFEAGRVFIVRNIQNAQVLYDQLIEFPAGSHDDMVDALVYAIRMLLVDGYGTEEDITTAGSYSYGESKSDDDDDDADDGW